MSRISDRIGSINAKGIKAVIPYVPAGYPTLEKFREIIRELDRPEVGAIEIGIPFSDPVADGPVVEAASLECLDAGMTLAKALAEVKNCAPDLKAPLVFMGYCNSFLRYGVERFARDAAAAGLSGVIVPDLPLEEAEEMREALRAAGIDLIPLVGVNTSDERLQAYARTAQGFVYCVSVLGTTGVREEGGFSPELEGSLRRVRNFFSVPLALGFGLKRPGQLDGFGNLIDAGVIGSALIRHIDAGGGIGEFFSRT